MPSYLWPMTSPCPVLARYRLVRSRPYTRLSSMYVQNLLVAHAFAVVGLPVCCPFLTIFWFPFLLWLAHLRDWPLLDGGLCLSLAHHFFCYHLLPCYSIIPAAKLFASILLGLFGPAVYSFPNGPVRSLVLLLHHWRALVSHLFSLGRPWPICFPWASLALFLTLHSHGLLLSSLGFPSPIALSLILGTHGLIINPLLSLLSLIWACRGPFSFFHIIYCPWFAFFSLSRLL